MWYTLTWTTYIKNYSSFVLFRAYLARTHIWAGVALLKLSDIKITLSKTYYLDFPHALMLLLAYENTISSMPFNVK